MSEVLKALRDSTDPLENDLAQVYDHWQGIKRNQGQRAGLGYEPRDINAIGAAAVISGRVLKASSGFEEVDPKLSYEAIVLKYPDRFEVNVIAAAKERLTLGTGMARFFRNQDIKFFIKTSSIELFGKTGVSASKESWMGRYAQIPDCHKDNSSEEKYLENGFRGFVWLHEQEKKGERGRGLTAVVEFSAINTERTAKILDVVIFEHPVGKDLLEAHKDDSEFITKIDRYRHTRIWPVADSEVLMMLAAVRAKVHKISEYETQIPNPNEVESLEKTEDTTTLRQVVLRRYQSAFRQALLDQRPNCCAISGTSETSVLEAAHIIPYSEKFADRDKPENGLLLRSDIHKLFDTHLITINPITRTIEVAKSVVSQDYLQLEGQKVDDALSAKSLSHHFENFNRQSS